MRTALRIHGELVSLDRVRSNPQKLWKFLDQCSPAERVQACRFLFNQVYQRVQPVLQNLDDLKRDQGTVISHIHAYSRTWSSTFLQTLYAHTDTRTHIIAVHEAKEHMDMRGIHKDTAKIVDKLMLDITSQDTWINFFSDIEIAWLKPSSKKADIDVSRRISVNAMKLIKKISHMVSCEEFGEHARRYFDGAHARQTWLSDGVLQDIMVLIKENPHREASVGNGGNGSPGDGEGSVNQEDGNIPSENAVDTDGPVEDVENQDELMPDVESVLNDVTENGHDEQVIADESVNTSRQSSPQILHDEDTAAADALSSPQPSTRDDPMADVGAGIATELGRDGHVIVDQVIHTPSEATSSIFGTAGDEDAEASDEADTLISSNRHESTPDAGLGVNTPTEAGRNETDKHGKVATDSAPTNAPRGGDGIVAGVGSLPGSGDQNELIHDIGWPSGDADEVEGTVEDFGAQASQSPHTLKKHRPATPFTYTGLQDGTSDRMDVDRSSQGTDNPGNTPGSFDMFYNTDSDNDDGDDDEYRDNDDALDHIFAHTDAASHKSSNVDEEAMPGVQMSQISSSREMLGIYLTPDPTPVKSAATSTRQFNNCRTRSASVTLRRMTYCSDDNIADNSDDGEDDVDDDQEDDQKDATQLRASEGQGAEEAQGADKGEEGEEDEPEGETINSLTKIIAEYQTMKHQYNKQLETMRRKNDRITQLQNRNTLLQEEVSKLTSQLRLRRRQDEGEEGQQVQHQPLQRQHHLSEETAPEVKAASLNTTNTTPELSSNPASSCSFRRGPASYPSLATTTTPTIQAQTSIPAPTQTSQHNNTTTVSHEVLTACTQLQQWMQEGTALLTKRIWPYHERRCAHLEQLRRFLDVGKDGDGIGADVDNPSAAASSSAVPAATASAIFRSFVHKKANADMTNATNVTKPNADMEMAEANASTHTNTNTNTNTDTDTNNTHDSRTSNPIATNFNPPLATTTTTASHGASDENSFPATYDIPPQAPPEHLRSYMRSLKSDCDHLRECWLDLLGWWKGVSERETVMVMVTRGGS